MNELFDNWPPLKGKAALTPTGIFDINWHKLEDAYGNAQDTPYYIIALTSDDEKDVQNGGYGLYAATTHQGSVYTASQAAIPFLVALLEAGYEHGASFLGRIAIGEAHWTSAPEDFKNVRSIYFNDVLEYLPRLQAAYQKWDFPDLEHLLCGCPNGLPDYLDVNIPTDSEKQIIKLAGRIVAQGFIAAERNLQNHIDLIRTFTKDQPFIIRLAAHLCLAYSQAITPEELAWMLQAKPKSSDVGIQIQQLDKNICENGERIYCSWTWSADLSDMVMGAYAYVATDEDLLTNEQVSFEVRRDQLLKRHFGSSKPLLYTPESLSPLQKRVIAFMLTKENLPLYLEELYHLPKTIEALERLLEQREDTFTKRYNYRRSVAPLPVWYCLSSYLYGNGTESEIVPILRQLPNLWEAISELHTQYGNGERLTIQHPRFFEDTVSKSGYEVHRTKLFSCLALAMQPYLDEIKTFLTEWLPKIPDLDENRDWGFKTANLKMGIGLLALARYGQLTPEYYPLVRPYHNSAEYSRIPLSIIAEILSFTHTAYQEKIYTIWCKGHLLDISTDESWKETTTEPIGFFRFEKKAWLLLTGCRNDWVIPAIQEVVEQYEHAQKQYTQTIVMAPFPYELAAQCIRQQEKVDVKLLAKIASL